MTCLHCEGWTCAHCASPHDVAAAGGGEQSLTSTELEVVALRRRVRDAETGAKLAHDICAVLATVVGDSGESEGAVQVAKRLIRERQELRSRVARLRTLIRDTKAALELPDEHEILVRIDEALR